jgi:hypothetical protein
MADIILTFKDQQYPLAKVLAKGKAGQPIVVALKDLDSSKLSMDLVKLSAESKDFEDAIIFYKHEGKYLPFTGQLKVLAMLAQGLKEIKGHLLTSYMLKGVRIDKPIAESVKVQAVEQLADKFSSPRPAPRTYDNKTPRSTYGSNNRSAPRQASGNTLHARSSGNRSGS